ncbi:PQQ-dependent sugar dehydrogenase, partial [Vibrio antiquarius]
MKTITATLLACLAFSIDAADYRANEVANGFQIPWGIEFLDKQQMIVNEKNGTVSLLNITSGKQQTLFKVPNVNTSGQAGLLDVALVPNTAPQNPQLFFTYSKRTDKGNTV